MRIKAILFAIFAFVIMTAPVAAQTGTSQSTSSLNTEVKTKFADQMTGQITPLVMRQMLLDLIASMSNVTSLGVASATDYGADPTGVKDSTQAIQQAVNLNNIVTFPCSTFLILGTVTITNPVHIIGCAKNSVVTATGTNFKTANDGAHTTNDFFHINSNDVTIENINCNGLGSRSGIGLGKCIAVGTDSTVNAAGSMTNFSMTLSSTTATFTSADIGKEIRVNTVNNGNALFTTITGFTNSTTVTLGAQATGCVSTCSPVTFTYGNPYAGTILHNVSSASNSIAVHFISAINWILDGVFTDDFFGIQIENILNADQGAGKISNSRILSNATAGTGGIGINYLSNGDVFITNTKFLFGDVQFAMSQSLGSSANLLVTNSDFEGYNTNALSVTTSVLFTGVTFTGNRFGGGGNATSVINIDNTSSVQLANFNFVGNIVDLETGSGTLITLGQVNGCLVEGNTINGSGTNQGILVSSNAVNCNIGTNTYVSLATPLNNQSTTSSTPPLLMGQNIVGRFGGMEIWQRPNGGTGSGLTVPASTAAMYTVDGCYLTTNANQQSFVAQTVGTAINSVTAAFIRRNATQSGLGQYVFGCPLDTDELTLLQGRNTTLSFTASLDSNFSGVSSGQATLSAITASLLCGTSTPTKQVNGFAGQTTPITIVQALTATPKRFFAATAAGTPVPTNCTQAEIQFTWNPMNYVGLGPSIPAANADRWFLDDVQLEVTLTPGTTPTTYQMVDFATQLNKARRYFVKTFTPGVSVSTAAGFAGALAGIGTPTTSILWRFPVTMRTTPIITTFNPAANNANCRDITAAADRTVTVDPDTAISPDQVWINCFGQGYLSANHIYIQATSDAGI